MSRARHGFRHATRRFFASSAAAILIALTGAAPASAVGDFQLLVTPTTEQLLPPGGSIEFLVQVGSVGGFADEVTLEVGALPNGVTHVLSDDAVTPPATVHLTLIASEDAEVGTFAVVVTGTSGAITHEATGRVEVDFGLIPVCFARVVGTVTDRATNLPIANAEILNFPFLETDAQGNYSYDEVGLGSNNAPVTFSILARKAGYWQATSEPADFVCGQLTRVDLTLLPQIGATAHGTVVEGTVDPNDPTVVIPGDTPIADIRVGFELNLPGSGPDTTDATGAYEIALDQLGADNTPVNASLFALAPGNFDEQVFWPRSGSSPSPILIGEVSPGDDITVPPIGMVRKCFGSISGTLVYGDTQQPAVGVTVSASHQWYFASDVTDATGAYDIPVIALGYNNQPVDVGLSAFETSGFYGSAQGQTHFGACGADKVVALELPPVLFGSVEGRVTDVETDLPLPGASVSFRFFSCPTCDPPPPWLADAEGDYRINRIPAFAAPDKAGYQIEANHSGYWWEIHDFEISAGDVATRNFALLRKKFASLSGTVTDAITGLPIAGATGGANHKFPGTTTNAQGTYAQSEVDIGHRNLPLAGSVSFVAPGYWPAQVQATFEADKETIANLEMIPICEGATIRGKVVDATNQEPLEGASVVVIGNGGDLTGPDGTYEITGVQVGTFNSPISVTVVASKTGYISQTKTITVFCGASIFIPFGPPPPPGALEGVVTDCATGDPIPNVLIVGEFGQETRTDADGYYLFEEVPVNDDGSPKEWNVTALPDGFPLQTKPVTIRADETSRLDFAFGCVETPTGKIVVKVETQPADSSQPFSFTRSYGSTFNLTDGQSNDSGPLEAGKTYSVSQTAVPGWDTTASCDQGQTPASIALAANTTVTCTFTNVQRGSIVINKTAAGGDGTFGFTSQALGGFSIATTTGSGSKSFPDLVPGDFAVAETVPPGWDLASATCTQGSTPAAITVGPGQTVACTFVNNKRGTASVTKTVSGSAPSGTQSFAFELRQGASATAAGTHLASGTATATNGGSVSFTPTLVAGATYQLCEVVMPGWNSSLGPNPFTLFNPTGDNSTLCADFTVQAGQARVLTIDNTPPPGGLTRTIGFWKNWSSCSKGKQAPVLDRTLAKSEPAGITIGRLTLHGSATRPDVAPDCKKAFNLLDKTTIDGKKKSASDPAFSMAAQLLAAKLNVMAEAESCTAATDAIAAGQALLDAVAFNGLTHTKLTAAQTTQANALATTLDRYNNGLLC